MSELKIIYETMRKIIIIKQIFDKEYFIDKHSLEFFNLIQDIKNKVKDIISKSNAIDGIIKENLETWDINRVGKAELAIIRLAVYEMYYDETVDLPVAINEAVELAKTYGDDKAPKFVNGVLSTVYKNHK